MALNSVVLKMRLEGWEGRGRYYSLWQRIRRRLSVKEKPDTKITSISVQV